MHITVGVTQHYFKEEELSHLLKQKFIFSTQLLLKIPVFPVAEFSVSICNTPKFICSSDDDVPRLLITGNDTCNIKATFAKTG